MTLYDLVCDQVNTRFDDKCWVWELGHSSRYGSPICTGKGNSGRKRPHVVAYELRYGGVPAGLELDHICRNTLCWNPAHLRVVTKQQNLFQRDTSRMGERNRIKTHCIRGHEFSKENTRISKASQGRNGYRRICKACHREGY